MVKYQKIVLLTFITLLISIGFFNQVLGDDDDDDYDDDLYDDHPFFGGDDNLKDLGELSLVFLGIGSFYILFRRTYVYSNQFLSKERYPEVKAFIKVNYHRFRRPVFLVHVYASLIATLLAGIHGIPLLIGDEGMVLSGILAGGSMLILSLSGFVMWRRQKPFWSNRDSRKAIRWMHRQWLFTGLTVLGLFLHLVLLED